jgi:hypothetical protein
MIDLHSYTAEIVNFLCFINMRNETKWSRWIYAANDSYEMVYYPISWHHSVREIIVTAHSDGKYEKVCVNSTHVCETVNKIESFINLHEETKATEKE